MGFMGVRRTSNPVGGPVSTHDYPAEELDSGRINLIACVDRLADIAAALGEEIEGLSKREAAEKASLAVRQLSKSIGLPATLSEYGADPQLIPSLAKWASKDGDLPGNPRVPTLEQIEELYKEAFTGKPGLA